MTREAPVKTYVARRWTVMAMLALGAAVLIWRGLELTLTRKDFGMEYDLGPAATTVELKLGIEGIQK